MWGNWTEWTNCTALCGGGLQNRTRTIATNATNGGNDCTGPTEESRACNPDSCSAGRKRRSFGIMEELSNLPELVRKRREVRYRCNKTMTYGLMFYDIRNKEVNSLLFN